MSSLTFFPVTGTWTAPLGTLTGLVTFKMLVNQGSILVAPNLDTPSIVVPTIVQGRISDGVLYGLDGNVGVNLIANTDVLGLATPLFYRVSFQGLSYTQPLASLTTAIEIDAFDFVAPTDSTGVDLVNVAPMASVIAGQVTKGDQGFGFAGITALNGGTSLQGLVQSLSGPVPAGDPADITTAIHDGVVTVLEDDSSVIDAANAAVSNAIQGQIGSGLHYRGLWSASANTPTLHDGTGTAGDQWLATTAGTINLGSGAQTFAAGDYAIYNGSTWDRVPASLILAAGQVLKHGSNATYARPGGASIVVWAGTVSPSNAVDGDMFADYSGTAPTFTTTTLNSLNLGAAFDQFLIATGSTPVIFTVTGGSLPTGLVLSSAGELYGTPTTSGAYSFTVTATNGYGTGTQTFSGTVGAAIAPTITTTTLGGTPTAGVAYSQILVATGSTPITWSVNSGALPSGLSLNTSTGVISGTPSSSGSYSFTIRATNSVGFDDQAFSGSITGTAPSITTTSLSSLSQGTPFSQTPVCTGTTPITWSISAGTIPAGLSQDTGTGQIYGTPTSSGSYSFTVTATNSYGSTSQLYTGTVSAATPAITTTSLNTIWRAIAFSQTLVATGATPITWSVTTGSLPSGLSLGSSTGILSGTATTTGAYSFTVTATNSYGNTTQAFSGSVTESTPAITTSSLSSMTISTAFSQTLAATGAPTITWSVLAGSLPSGLSLNSSTGVLSGTPTASGAYSFTIRASNSIGNGDQAYSGTVAALTPSFRAAGTPTTGTNSISDTSVAGDTCILWLSWGTNVGSTISASHSTGATMTQIGSSVLMGSVATTNQYAAAFKFTSTGSGTITVTPAGGTVSRAVVVSYTNVGTVGTTLANAVGATTALAVTASSATGHLVANCMFQVQVSPTLSGYTQTQRVSSSNSSGAILAGDAAGASSVSFALTSSSSGGGAKWGALAVDLTT